MDTLKGRLETNNASRTPLKGKRGVGGSKLSWQRDGKDEACNFELVSANADTFHLRPLQFQFDNLGLLKADVFYHVSPRVQDHE